MSECSICGASVADAQRHREFHEINRLHAPDCAWLLQQRAQEGTGAYLTPYLCTCGLNNGG